MATSLAPGAATATATGADQEDSDMVRSLTFEPRANPRKDHGLHVENSTIIGPLNRHKRTVLSGAPGGRWFATATATTTAAWPGGAAAIGARSQALRWIGGKARQPIDFNHDSRERIGASGQPLRVGGRRQSIRHELVQLRGKAGGVLWVLGGMTRRDPRHQGYCPRVRDRYGPVEQDALANHNA